MNGLTKFSGQICFLQGFLFKLKQPLPPSRKATHGTSPFRGRNYKVLFLLIGILAACLSASSQINRIEYFWDTDPGFGSGIALPITPGDSVSAVFTFSTIGLLPGVHTLYIRSRDISGRWSVFSKKAIRIEEAIYPISKAEYFYDTDPGFGNGTPLPFTPPLDSLFLAPGIPTNALAPGLHTLYVRVRDTNGKWSVFSKKAIHIQQPVYPISNAEYFVDTDPGFGNGTPISITPGDSIDTIPAINTTSLTPGIHTVYVRVKTTNGEWSVFSKRPIHIQYPESPLIVAAEAFVDADPGFGNGTPITLTSGGDSVLANFSVPTASLSLGIHMVYVRVKYSNNQWSVFSKKLIYIDNPADDPIIAAEYFVDNDPGIGNATVISITPGDSVLANFSVPTDTLLIGPHWLYVRVKDAEARWSVYSKDSFYVGNFNCSIYGNGEIGLTGDTCRGTQLTFKDKTTSNSGVNSNDYTREWDFFYDGSVDFTDSMVNYTFNQTGTYTVKLKVNEIANPFCQEVIIKTLTIRRIDTTYNNVTICTGEFYNAGGGNQTTSGIYYDTYNNRYGCDSVRVTDLTVDSNLTASVTIAVEDTNVCSGVSTVFTATPVNGGTPYFTWKVNGAAVGAGYSFQGYNPFGISTLTDGQTVTCEMLSSITCASSNPATSNSIIMNVTQSVAASITIDVDTNNFCSGSTATFTVINVTNEGSNPKYDWYVDNGLAQTGGTTFVSSTLVSGNFVRCYLTSDEVCVSNSSVSSNVIYMTVFGNGYPAVSIQANTNSVCYATPIGFTAFPSFGGNNPNYQWFLNDTLSQSGSSNTYSNDTLDDNDKIKCVLTSDYQCRLADYDTSNTVTMDIIYNLPVSVTLTPGGNNICEGTGVTFTASVTNGGTPAYQFFVNGTSVQNSSLYYYSSSTLNDNDSIWVTVTSDISCASNNPATSNKVFMTVVKYDTVSVSIVATDDTICEGTNVTFSATAINPGAAPTYLWRVNNAQVQSGLLNTYNSASLGNGSIVKCELYGDHQCVTPNPAVSNSITMMVTDTLLPVALVSIPQNLICEGTNVNFTATIFNEGNNPTIEWLLNNNVVQTGGLTYNSSTLQDFDAVRLRLTSDYVCPKQNPVLSSNVVMTVIDSITPAVFAYHGPNPACPGNLISVFTTTSTGGSLPIYEFRKNGNIVQSGQQSQYTSSNFTNGDVMQVSMTSNASCLRTTTALSNTDTIKIQSFIAAGVSIQVISQASCAGDTTTFEATTNTGGLNPIFTWRVNNAVFQSSGSNIFVSTALQNGDSVYCEMNSGLSCATNNPAKSQTVTIQFPGCCINDEDCDDGNQCTDDVCDNSNCTHNAVTCDDGNNCTLNDCNSQTGCFFTPINCDDSNPCTDDYCDVLTGSCIHDTIPGCGGDPCDTLVCADNNICTFDTCLFGACIFPFTDCGDANACTLDSCNSVTGCFNTPIICDDGNLCTLDSCHSQTGCTFIPVNCDDSDLCTTDDCDTLSGSCFFIPNANCGNACDTLTCIDNNLCTVDGCDSLSGCFFTPVSCSDNDLCTTNSCDSLSGCVFNPINCDDDDSCTIDGCDPSSGCFNLPDPTCFYDCTILNCVDGNACTTDDCDSLSGCFYNPVICNDNNICTSDGCNQVVGCTFTPVNCNDGEPCTDDYCDTLSSSCIHDTIPGCGNPCDTLTCFDNNLCTTDTCANGSCVFNPISCNDGDACSTDSCDSQSGCFHASLICDDGNLCTSDNCNTQTGCAFSPVVCNDNNLCTSDGCDSLAGCTFSAIICDDNNLCTTDGCDLVTGCSFTQVNCNDGILCTDDYCDTLNGLCVHDTLPGCVNPCDTLTCFDNDLCTTNGCVNDACVFNPISCNDGDACTMDSCDAQSSCFYATTICDDSSLCTTDNCNSQTGCTFSPIICDDNNVCTANGCDSLTGCTFSAIICDDNDLCTTDGCNLATGCTFTPVKCDDNNVCTDDYCDVLNGLCVYDTLPGCVNPCDTLTCIDNNLCTTDNCSNGACAFNPVDCNDGDACTTDDCDPLSGCSYTSLICNDGDLCTSDNCNTLTGCAFTPINCDDNNLCTADGCDLFTGCTNTPVACDDNNLCTTNGCDPASGCSYSPVNCSDNNQCTTDACDSLTGCTHTAIICNDNDSCTADACVNGICTYQTLCCITNSNCNDLNPCTDDFCVNGTCARSPVDCDDTDLCTVDVCVNGNCLNRPLNCVDGNPCTDDFCTNGVCQNELMNCDDGNDCTRDFCQNGICKNIPLSCADGNPCTIDSCSNGLCINQLINCDDNDPCTTDFCQNGNCINRPVNCVDGNGCTIDSCINGTCQYFPVNCNDGIGCTNDFCQNGTCINILGNCNDNDACTSDQCVNGACVNTSVNCDDGEACTADSCTNGQCAHQQIDCNDFDSCTSDTCINGQCQHTVVVSCDDNDACTVDQCALSGCTHTPIYCNDNNPCTTDACDNGVCQFTDERRVLSFTLVDAATDTDIGMLNDGDTIDLFVTPSINVRANICTTSDIESVKFLLNGSFFRLENILFYTIAGDNNGNYDPWNVQPGVYTIRAIPYNGNNGTGIVGIYNEITITIIDGTPPCGGNDRKVVDFTLVDAATDSDIGTLLDGDTIDLFVTPLISVRANVCLNENIESVKFLVNGSFHIMENILFYTIAGDNGGNYNPWNVAPGIYTIRTIPYSGNNGAGITGTYHEVTIVIINGALPCQANDIRINSFTLVSETTNSDIMPLADGAVIDLAQTGPINVRANVFCDEHIESVKFKLNANNSYRIENIAPYALAGDANSDYFTWNVSAGIYTIQATPYSGNNAGGAAGTPSSITITIVGSAAKMDAEEQLLNEPAEEETTMLNAYPNPFRDILNIEFSVQEDSKVKLEIFNVAGQKIATLFEGDVKASALQKFEYKRGVASDGMIIYRLRTNNTTFYGKAVMVK